MVQRQGPAVQTYVVFQVGENEFALPLYQIRQIVSAEGLEASEDDGGGDKAGTISYRGRSVDVIDMGERLAIVARRRRQPSIVVLNEPRALRAILVDSAPITTSIEARQVRPLPAIVRSPGDPYEAVAKLGENRLVILLDAGRL